MRHEHSINKNGFTLIEVLLYLAITATMLGGLAAFIGLLTAARMRDQTVTEVASAGIQIVQLITQTVRNAAQTAVPNATTLLVTDPQGVQSTFQLVGTILWWTRAGQSLPLTENKVLVKNVRFTTTASTPPSIRMELTLDHHNPTERIESTFSKTWYATANPRP